MLQSIESQKALLSRHDPDPVEVLNEESGSEFVLICEHAGRALPTGLGDLGIDAAQMDRHIAYDIGAEGLSRKLSTLLGAPLVLQRYSRLVVDCNRPFAAPDCFPEVSDGTVVPANARLSETSRRQRFGEIHQPFHNAVSLLLDRRVAAMKPTALVTVHSFTPSLLGGNPRPWHLGVLSNRDSSFALRFLDVFQQNNPDFLCAHNEPYVVDDLSDYTIPVHGERRGLPHLLLEIRNDLIAGMEGQSRWARLVAEALRAATPLQKGHENGR